MYGVDKGLQDIPMIVAMNQKNHAQQQIAWVVAAIVWIPPRCHPNHDVVGCLMQAQKVATHRLSC